MTPESRTRVITIAEVTVLVAVLVAGLLVGWYLARRAPSTGTIPVGPGAGSGTVTSTTRGEVPSDIKVPNPGDTASGDVAIPTAVVDAAPGVDSKRRSFDVAFNGSNFAPSQVIVYAGDTTSIKFTTSGGTCEFSQPDMGLASTFTTERDQLIEITPDASMSGKYAFFCKNLGGPESGPVGYLLVAPK